MPADSKKLAESGKNTPSQRKVLVCISGMSPAIITETYYWLAHCRQPAFVPDDVIVITTGDGARVIKQKLFDPANPRFQIMCEKYGWRSDSFTPASIHVAHDHQGVELPDVRTVQDFNAFANTVLQVIRELTSGDRAQETSIHASLAGGRKTMSYYMGQAMNIFGRSQDRLSHILLDPAYEAAIDFYYPGQPECELHDRNNKPLALSVTRENILTMAEFPILSLSRGINIERLRNTNLSFDDIMTILIEEQAGIVNPISFERGASNLLVNFGRESLRMSPGQLAALIWLGWRARKTGEAVVLGKRSHFAKKMDLAYREYKLVSHFVRYPGNSFHPEELADEEWQTEEERQRKHFETVLTRLRESLKRVSPVYAFDIKEAGPDGEKTTVKGKYQIPSTLLNDDDFQEIDYWLEKYIPVLYSWKP